MIFDIITIFPDIFDSYFKESILARARKKKLIKINVHNLRDFAKDKHRVIDDKPFGGGIGMVMKIEPFYNAVNKIKSKNPKQKIKVIAFTPRAEKFDQKKAYQLSKLDRVIMLCGRYEGIDERVSKIIDMELSIGDYVLMGGEIPAMIVTETICRLIPGVIGKPQLLKERIPKIRGAGGRGFIEYPQYTRPEIFTADKKKGINWKVPKVLVSGDHKKIQEWRKKHQKLVEK